MITVPIHGSLGSSEILNISVHPDAAYLIVCNGVLQGFRRLSLLQLHLERSYL